MLSIIIPTYKRTKKINKLVADIKALYNDEFPYEIIVVNDDIKKIQIEGKVKLIQPLVNNGGQVARGIGLKKSKYNNIIFLDDDDEVTENFFKTINQSVDGTKDIVYFDLLIQQRNGNYKKQKMTKKLANKPWLQNTLFQNKIFSKSVLNESYFSKILLYQDENIFFKTVDKNLSYLICNSPIIRYKYNQGSVSKFDDYRKKFDRLKTNYEEFVAMPDKEMTLYARGRLFSFLTYWNKLGKLNEGAYLKSQKSIQKKFTPDDRGRFFLSKFK